MEYLHIVESIISHIKYYLTKETLPVNDVVNDKMIKDIQLKSNSYMYRALPLVGDT